MPDYFMAIDIGASSGRHIAGWLDGGGAIRLRELHRFPNIPRDKNGSLVWDADALFAEVLRGLAIAGEEGMRPVSVGIDTWGVDFVLLDGDGDVIGDAVCYRDARTAGMEEKVNRIVGRDRLYRRTGIQPLVFNTIFQLRAIGERSPERLAAARHFLMMPDYLAFLLTGEKRNEYTNASTTQLLNAESREWDGEILRELGIPSRIFLPPGRPGERVGALRSAVRERVGYGADVLLAPTHDTASAVLAVPGAGAEGGERGIYLSSGTWSLIGIERAAPDLRLACRDAGFTNEGGFGGRFRFLKNIMGLWILQRLRGEMGDAGFDELAAMAEECEDFPSIVDVGGNEYLAPPSMKRAIRDGCAKAGAPVPGRDGEVLMCAYRSLAACYAEAAREIDALSGARHGSVRIVGGGCRDALLNRLTAEATGREVYAGPVEATAVGNILAQMIGRGVFPDAAAARRAVARSFDVAKVEKGTAHAAF